MNTREIQQRLEDMGFDVGPVDGIRGRRTIAAIKRFQAMHRLVPDGIVGPKTTAAMFTKAPIGDDLPWFEEANRLMGLREVSGPGSSPFILDWADDLDLHYPSDDIPWCGLFVAHCIGATLPEEVLPVNPLGARNWQTFGAATKPTLGCVLVFWRKSIRSFMGHVGFYAGEDSSTFTVLGGNQSDSVSKTRIAKDRLLAARWPSSAPAPKITVADGVGGAVSTNEA